MNTSYKIQIVGVSALAGVFLFSVSAFAMTGSTGLPETKLQEAKLQACQAREEGIKNRSTHLTNLAKNIEDKFDAILTRVQNYYTNKVVPSGKTLSNYDTLVSNIQTKKTAVQTALTKAQNDVATFSCTSGSPKDAMLKFKTDMLAVKQALKEYRTSIKNLIVSVHGVTETEQDNTNK